MSPVIYDGWEWYNENDCAHGPFVSCVVLMPLLEYCSVRPDTTVANHRFFGPDAEIR
jgi:hypothetical protein